MDTVLMQFVHGFFACPIDWDFATAVSTLAEDDEAKISDLLAMHDPAWKAKEYALLYCLRWRLWKCAKLLRKHQAHINWNSEFNRLTRAELHTIITYGLHGPTIHTPAYVNHAIVLRPYCRRSVCALILALKRHSPYRGFVAPGIVDYIATLVWDTQADDEWCWSRAYKRNPKNVELPKITMY